MSRRHKFVFFIPLASFVVRQIQYEHNRSAMRPTHWFPTTHFRVLPVLPLPVKVGGFQLFAFSAATNDEPLHVQITANSTDVYLRFPTSVAESIVNDGQSSQKGTNDMLYSAMIMVFGFLSFTYSIYMAHADIYSPVALKSLLKQGMKGDGAGIAAFLMTLRKIESTQFAKAMKRTSSKGCSSSIEPFSEFVKDRTKLEKAIGAVLESLDGGRNVASGSGVNQG